MAFNPFKRFGMNKEKVKVKPAPSRGPGGKFMSTKPKQDKKEVFKGPYLITFYGHEIRRFYKNSEWYFSLDDIAHVAYINADDPRVRKGDPKKLSEAKKENSIQIDGVEVAKPKDIVKFIPYFKGNMPGPIADWLLQNSLLPAPLTPETNE